jgi:hypothetical protein
MARHVCVCTEKDVLYQVVATTPSQSLACGLGIIAAEIVAQRPQLTTLFTRGTTSASGTPSVLDDDDDTVRSGLLRGERRS